MPGPHRRPVLQLHPTRRCNLRCLHCYSSSGPSETETLPIELLLDAIEDACEAGYTALSVSGGEPLLYAPLPQLLACGRLRGMSTAVTTNGMLLSERQLARLDGVLDLLAISLDGVPESHNRMRASPRAFTTMERNLAKVRARGWRFGFIFTLTQHNLHELDWVYRFAREQGAALLQVHPLELAGRARETMPEAQPDSVEFAYAVAEWARLRRAADNMLVHIDLADRRTAAATPERFLATGAARMDAPLADLVSPLVVESDGTVVPLQHGFSRTYALGTLHRARLRVLAAQWKTKGYAEFAGLCQTVWSQLAEPSPQPFFNWYQAVSDAAESMVTDAASEPLQPQHL